MCKENANANANETDYKNRTDWKQRTDESFEAVMCWP